MVDIKHQSLDGFRPCLFWIFRTPSAVFAIENGIADLLLLTERALAHWAHARTRNELVLRVPARRWLQGPQQPDEDAHHHVPLPCWRRGRDEESALWMLGKVRDPYMKRYIDSLLRAQAADKNNPEGAIVADFVAWDFPTAKQASNDSGLGSRSDALGEVKTMQPGNTSYKKEGNCQENTGEQACRPTRYPSQAELQEVSCRPRSETCARRCVGDGTNGQVSGGSIRDGPWNILHQQRPPLCHRSVRRSQ